MNRTRYIQPVPPCKHELRTLAMVNLIGTTILAASILAMVWLLVSLFPGR